MSIQVPAGNRRLFGRIAQSQLMCDLGPVLDISRGGMRIQTRRRVEGLVPIHIVAEDGPLKLTGRVVWCKRRGFFKFEIGVEFLDIDLPTSLRITQLATTYAVTFKLAG